MRELPYEFDLLYDIKMMYEVKAVATGEPTHSDATAEELVDLFEQYHIPKPSCLMGFSNTKKERKKEKLLVVVIKDGLVDRVVGCENSKIQKKIFKQQVIERSGFEPEECDYEDGYYEWEQGGAICMASC